MLRPEVGKPDGRVAAATALHLAPIAAEPEDPLTGLTMSFGRSLTGSLATLLLTLLLASQAYGRDMRATPQSRGIYRLPFADGTVVKVFDATRGLHERRLFGKAPCELIDRTWPPRDGQRRPETTGHERGTLSLVRGVSGRTAPKFNAPKALCLTHIMHCETNTPWSYPLPIAGQS